MWLEVEIYAPSEDGLAQETHRAIINTEHIWGVEPANDTDESQGCKMFTLTGIGFMVKTAYVKVKQALQATRVG